MFTVCPKCSLKLVVTAADLRVAQGYVRCGRCSNVFNALIGLSDEQQAVLAREAASADAGRAPRPTPEEEERAEAISDAALEFDPTQTDVSEVFIEPRLDEPGGTGSFESITLRSDEEPAAAPPQPSAPPPQIAAEARLEGNLDALLSLKATAPAPTRPQNDPRGAASNADVHEFELPGPNDDRTPSPPPAAPAGAAAAAAPGAPLKVPPAADAQGVPPRPNVAPSFSRSSPGARLAAVGAASSRVPSRRRPEPEARSTAAPADSAKPMAVSPVAAPIADALEVTRAPDIPATTDSPRTQRLLHTVVAVLAVLLGAQVIHHYRVALAEVQWLRPPLTAIYAALGMPLEPRWDVAAYEVHQLGAIAGADQAGGLIVRASIKNTAAQPQPLPLLRVTLQDRFGNHVAARDVPPRSYLPAKSSRSAYLAPGQRVDAEVQLVDPGASAVGFEIDACLADGAGRVSCANDASSASVEP